MKDFLKINDYIIVAKENIDNISYNFLKKELEIETRYPDNRFITIYPFDRNEYEKIMNEMEKYIEGSDK